MNPQRTPDEIIRRILSLAAQGIRKEDIAKVCRVSLRTVYYVLAEGL